MYLQVGSSVETIGRLHKMIEEFVPFLEMAEHDYMIMQDVADSSYNEWADFCHTDEDMSDWEFKLKKDELQSRHNSFSDAANFKMLVVQSLIDGLRKQLRSV